MFFTSCSQADSQDICRFLQKIHEETACAKFFNVYVLTVLLCVYRPSPFLVNVLKQKYCTALEIYKQNAVTCSTPQALWYML